MKIVGTSIVGAVFAILAITYRDPNEITPASTAISWVRDIPALDLAVIFGASVGAAIHISGTSAFPFHIPFCRQSWPNLAMTSVRTLKP